MNKRIGFVSTRLAGTDGVSLETSKWYQVLERNGYECYAFAGELDTPEERSFLEPRAHFNDPEVLEMHEACYGVRTRPALLTKQMHVLKDLLKIKLYQFCEQFKIDLIIPENVLAIPMHIPLGMAVTEFIAETGMPTVAHHHDFSWERSRFLVNAVEDYLNFCFPPRLPTINHVVINSEASRQLSYRRGISNVVIPNVFDFANPPEPSTRRAALRKALGFDEDDLFVLQPTRIVPRKWIERAIEIVSLLDLKKPRLVISHESGDEGNQYVERVMEYANRLGVELECIGDMVGSTRGFIVETDKEFNVDDVYQAADLITYPSGYEGFGNAFIEAIYFKKPVVMNRYSIFVEDIEPHKFDVIAFDGFVTWDTMLQIRQYLDPERRNASVEKNYTIGQDHFSYEVLEKKLLPLIESFWY